MATFQLSTIYPKFANIINIDIPKLANDPKKLKFFKQFGGFTDKKARQALQRGGNPIIITKKLAPHKWGYYPGSGNEVYINSVLVEQYENIHFEWGRTFAFSDSFTLPNSKNAQTNRQFIYTINKARLHLEATIVHEIVHWGDFLDGEAEDDEAISKGYKDQGHRFVLKAYDREIQPQYFQKNGKLKDSDVGLDGWLGWNSANQAFTGKAFDTLTIK